MTQTHVSVPRSGLRPDRKGSPPTAPLTLRRMVPPDWNSDRPAFPGDPDMDWESEPEPPRAVQAEQTAISIRRPS